MTENRRKRWTPEEIRASVQKEKDYSLTKIKELSTQEMLDEDGYPTKAAIDTILVWHWSDPKGWFDFIHSIWYLKSHGWDEGEEPHEYDKDAMVYRYHISTLGWSGNEGIVRAMQENTFMWEMNWVQSRRGGHYIFELRDYAEEN